MFGFDVHGDPFLAALLRRTNPDLKRPNEPVVVTVNVQALPAAHVRIFVGDRECDDPAELDRLADDIEARWGNAPAAGPAVTLPMTVARNQEGGDTRVRAAVGAIPGIRVKIKLDRDFDTYSVDEQDRLLEVVRVVHGCTSVVLISKQRGCVELTLELNPEEAERLYWLAQSGALDEFGVVFAETVGSREPSAAKKDPLPKRTRREKQIALGARWNECLTAAQKGDGKALGPLFAELEPFLRSRWKRLLRSDQIDDVLQATFLDVWERLPKYDPARGSAFAWVSAINRNVVLSILRRRRERLVDPEALADDPDVIVFQRSGRDPAEELEEADHAREMVRRALDQLSSLGPKARAVIRHRFLEGLTYKEAATKCGVSMAAVARVIWRWRQMVKMGLRED